MWGGRTEGVKDPGKITGVADRTLRLGTVFGVSYLGPSSQILWKKMGPWILVVASGYALTPPGQEFGTGSIQVEAITQHCPKLELDTMVSADRILNFPESARCWLGEPAKLTAKPCARNSLTRLIPHKAFLV